MASIWTVFRHEQHLSLLQIWRSFSNICCYGLSQPINTNHHLYFKLTKSDWVIIIQHYFMYNTCSLTKMWKMPCMHMFTANNFLTVKNSLTFAKQKLKTQCFCTNCLKHTYAKLHKYVIIWYYILFKLEIYVCIEVRLGSIAINRVQNNSLSKDKNTVCQGILIFAWTK